MKDPEEKINDNSEIEDHSPSDEEQEEAEQLEEMLDWFSGKGRL